MPHLFSLRDVHLSVSYFGTGAAQAPGSEWQMTTLASGRTLVCDSSRSRAYLRYVGM